MHESKAKPAKTKKKKQFPSQGIQTLFRVTYRTQVNLIRIADNKSHIIIGINAMVISIMIGMVGKSILIEDIKLYKNITLVIPIVLIIITAFLTAFYAVMATQPHIISPGKNEADRKVAKNLLFFENIWEMDPEDYIGKMEELLNVPEDLYRNMIIDIHNQAKVLHRKYRLLYISYVIFKYGYMVSIISFLILWFLS